MNDYKKLISGLIILVILILLYIGSVMLKNKTKTEQPLESSNLNQQQSDQTKSSQQQKYKYEYISNYNEKSDFTENNFDGKIIQIDPETGAKTNLVPSVKNAYPPLKKSVNLSLVYLNQSQEKPLLYFTTILMNSDGGYAGIIRFDASTKQFTKLTVGSDFNELGSMDRVSSSTPYAVITIPDYSKDGTTSTDRKLYLLDFDNDTKKLLTTLPTNQTFDSCYTDELGCPQENIVWINDQTVEVDIYDPNSKVTDSGVSGDYEYYTHKLLEKRKFNITQ